MCGIFFGAQFLDQEITCDLIGFQNLCKKLQEANSARGPDAQGIYQTYVTAKAQDGANFTTAFRSETRNTVKRGVALEFFASELRLRGHAPVVQPHEKDGDVLCWNGEVFEGMHIAPHENDGVKLFDAIRAFKTPEELPALFGSIEGPYAFVFYHTPTCLTQLASCRLYFARDPLGRRSLLIHKPTLANPYFLLASVSIGSNSAYEFIEVSTNSIFCIDILRMSNALNIANEFDSCVMALPRQRGDPLISSPLNYAEPSKVNTSLTPGDLPQVQSLDHVPDFLTQAVDDLIFHLDRSVMLRVRDIPQTSDAKGQARLAVLFSGGIDSTILTYLAHRHLPLDEPVDLLNVAFENPRKIQVQVEGNVGGFPRKKKREWNRETGDAANGKMISSHNVSYLVPDRISGLQEMAELRRLCPGRRWNFVEVNVPYEESQGARQTVEALMWPGRTVMDLSLAMALYFASRGTGQVRSNPDDPDSETYASPARVLLNGLGSDELLGGYGRHRAAFNTGGWQAVIDELQLEIDRIPTRNLGRDDRVMSSHGKETRHPFLSLSVVSFLAQLPVHFKMDPRLDVGLGDKTLLRLAARKLGLIEASARKKRAMQFGSHSARMDGGEKEGVAIIITLQVDSWALTDGSVPLGVAAAIAQSSIYDVPGGFRAVMFDRFSGVKDKASNEGTHFLVPWVQRAILYDCRIKPRNISTTTGSKDLQMVSITLRVLSRPDVEHLSKIYQSLGMDYDERVLPSIGNEVLKSIVAQFDAAELITQREVVSSRIREDLLQRAGEFNIKLEDVSITHLTFGKEFTQAVEAKQIAQQDAERAKFIVEKAEQERQAAVIRAEGEAEAAATISRALEKAGEAFVAFRKIEASKAIVQSLANNGNVTYIPSGGGNVLLKVPTK